MARQEADLRTARFQLIGSELRARGFTGKYEISPNNDFALVVEDRPAPEEGAK